MKQKLKPGLSGLSPTLQFAAAKAIAEVDPTIGNFARQMDAGQRCINTHIVPFYKPEWDSSLMDELNGYTNAKDTTR